MGKPENRILTPEQFADEVLDGRRSARWVRDRCAEFIRTEGKSGIGVIWPNRPYLIPASEAARFRANQAGAGAEPSSPVQPADIRAAALRKKYRRVFREKGNVSESRE